MRCHDVEERLLEYLYHELPEEEASPLEEHLCGCVLCRHRLQQMKGTREAFKEMPLLEPSTITLQSIMAHAEERLAGFPSRFFLPFWAKIIVPLASISVVLAVMVHYYGTGLQPPGEGVLSRGASTAENHMKDLLNTPITEETLPGPMEAQNEPPSLGVSPNFFAEVIKAFDEGNIKFQQKQFESAFRNFKRVFERLPNSTLAAISQQRAAESLEKMGRCSEAIVMYQQLNDRFPNYQNRPEVLVHIGSCYKSLGEDEKAMMVFSQLKKEFPSQSVLAEQYLHQLNQSHWP